MTGRRFLSLARYGLLLAAAGCAPALPFEAANPSDTSKGGEDLRYVSPFQSQSRFETAEPRPWRETNDMVRALGGAHAHMRPTEGEATQKAPK